MWANSDLWKNVDYVPPLDELEMSAASKQFYSSTDLTILCIIRGFEQFL